MAEQPIYRHIAEDLRQKIESGMLEPGSQLPTELELREQYDASRNTIRDAIKWLITRGLIETRPGQGTFVVDEIDPFVTTLTGELTAGGVSRVTEEMTAPGANDLYASEVRALKRTPRTTAPRVELQQANGPLATELLLDEDSPVVSRHQQRFIDNRPWSLQTSFYPMSFVEKGADGLIQAIDMTNGTVRYLKDTLGIEQTGYSDKLAVRPPDTTETQFFGLPSDGRVQVIEIRRLAFDQHGKPIRVTVTVYPADRNQFVINVGAVPPHLTSSGASESGHADSPIGEAVDGTSQGQLMKARQAS
jgi:GntR family transcriptional regulator